MLLAEPGVAPVLGEQLRPGRLRPAVEERRDALLLLLPVFALVRPSTSFLSVSREESRGDVVLVVLFPLEGCFSVFFFFLEEQKER